MSNNLARFIEIVARLRGPGGCPWDKEQTHTSIRTCLLEEAYEFFEALDENDDGKMREELGDLLLQIVLQAQMAQDRGAFTIDDVAREIADKIIRRHPHVFGDAKVASAAQVAENWEKIKKQETGKERRRYITDGIPAALPALMRAEKVQRRAAQAGFDWKSLRPVLDKVEEEFKEFREAAESGSHAHAGEELGDILFALVNVARHSSISAEDALRAATAKFERRFRFVEDRCRAAGKEMENATLEELDQCWEESKKAAG
jgi:tetrapyrrole methylase family protein/MazG family protein